jgi:isoleucyl-tRNA synthetase
MMKFYPDVPQQVKYPELENKILSDWDKNGTFEKSIEQRSKALDNSYVFYDGPPFANGLPHYGHLLTGYVKDVVPRYQTMKGKRVERRFGWDCHGLPPEMETEKDLKVSGRQAIQEFGIDKFNDHCRTAVMRYTKEWEVSVKRQARWVDFENDYKTMDLPYMESVMWAFKQLWDKGLIYEGYRVLPYSWACETPLSNFEIRMDNSTRPRQDPAVTVAFDLISDQGAKRKLLVWTTTPWTLPSNLAIAVGPEIEYSVLEENGVEYILASAVVKKYEAQLKNCHLKSTIKGSELVGLSYKPLFDYFKDHPNSFRILAGDFVSTEEGTGAVHMAPGFGEDDQKACEANNISIVCPVDDAGRFTEEVADFAGMQVFDANKEIIKALKDRGTNSAEQVLIKHETYSHNYPHCWRTDTPIIYRAMSSWYLKVSAIKQRMSELNQQIKWVPEHIKDGQFGKGIESAPDWSISRNRFWGSPIPVWKSDNPDFPRIDVYGSIEQLQKDFGVSVQDLHRPFIDSLSRPNPDDPSGKSTMRRVTEVLDCWFESGSMPFAQVHYPFENKEWFEANFPADFIVEYIAQTRGWFYTLMVLGTALFDKPPFKNCVCHGVVLDEDGQKLSKRKKNYPSPEEIFNSLGSDALRWFLMSSSILNGQDLEIDRDGKAISEGIRSVINPIWNAYYFFTLYANSDGLKAEFKTDSKDLLDGYILAKTHDLAADLTDCFDSYKLAEACRVITTFVDVLNNWYVRRSRERFWKTEQDQDKADAYNTLYTILVTLCKVSAPLLPLITEEIFRGLTNQESVHLADWPDANSFPKNSELVAKMDRIREICSVGLSLREANSLRTRLPLSKITIAGKNNRALADYSFIIRDELNVKEVLFVEETSTYANFNLQVQAKQLGPKIGGKVQEVIKASKAGQWKLLEDGRVEVGSVILDKEDFNLGLTPNQGVVAKALSSNDCLIILDTVITPELEQEGIARDLVRAIQQARKDAGLHVADNIKLSLELGETVKFAAQKHLNYIQEQVLAQTVGFEQVTANAYSTKVKLAGTEISLGIDKI